MHIRLFFASSTHSIRGLQTVTPPSTVGSYCRGKNARSKATNRLLSLSESLCPHLYNEGTSSTYGCQLLLLFLSLCCCRLVAPLCLTLVTPWTVAHPAPLSMGFPSKHTEVGCHFLLQRIFSTQELNLCLLHCK